MLDISVVIPTYNRKNILLKTIEGLFKQTYPKDRFEIVIVDDGSTDGTKEMIEDIVRDGRDRPQPRIIYVHQDPGKKGPAAANNLGIRTASGEYILMINDDIIPDKHLIEEHVKTQHVASQPKIASQQGQKIMVQGRVINTSSTEDVSKTPKGYSGGYSDISFGYFTTWNLSIKKQYLLDGGLFDEDFRNLCWEDVEFGFRLRRLGIKQKNNRNAFGYHFRHEFYMKDIDKVRDKSLKMGGNAVIYYKKHPCLEVNISTETFWLPMMMQSIFAFLIKIIGKEKIYSFMNHLEKTQKHRLLAFFVGLAGKYWFWTGIKEAKSEK